MKSIAVYPEFRGQGIGSDLLAFAEEPFSKKRQGICFYVSHLQSKAKKFYENMVIRL